METSTFTPATKRQLWALFCATKIDHRDKGLSKEQAKQLLDDLNKDRIIWTEKKVLSVIHECRNAGRAAAQAKLMELQKQGPAFAVCTETAPFSNVPDQVIDTMLDVCGNAFFRISARGKFYTLAKRLSAQSQYRFSCGLGYSGGGRLSIFDMTGRQEVSVNIAAYHAASDILDKYGIKNLTESWID